MGIIAVTYNKWELKRGKCRSCGKRTLIVQEEYAERERDVNKCPDCIEADRFETMSMKGLR